MAKPWATINGACVLASGASGEGCFCLAAAAFAADSSATGAGTVTGMQEALR